MTLIVMVIMSYFEFRLKGFRPYNQVFWSDSSIGLTFGRYAVAYTERFFSTAENSAYVGLSLECAIEPELSDYSGFRFLLLVHDGLDERQLVVGQWRSLLIIMNGDDYSYRRRIPRISVQLEERAGRAQLVTIVSSASGTAVFLDGRLKKGNKELVLTYPDKFSQTRLVVDNNLSAGHPWTGKILGIAFYDRALKEAKVLQHYQVWHRGKNFNAFQPDVPQILYAFDEGKGHIVHNTIEPGLDLMIPVWVGALEKSLLSWPKLGGSTIHSLIKDVVANLLGFIPLGFMLTATMDRFEGFEGRRLWGAVMLFSFYFSLVIEMVQGWITSRDSSIPDLTLNTLGSWLGFVIFNILWGHGSVRDAASR